MYLLFFTTAVRISEWRKLLLYSRLSSVPLSIPSPNIHGRHRNAVSCLELWRYSRPCAHTGSRSTAPPDPNLNIWWKRVAIFAPRPVYSPISVSVPIQQGEPWAPEPVWTVFGEGKCFAPLLDWRTRPSSDTAQCSLRRMCRRWRCLHDFRLPPRRKQIFDLLRCYKSYTCSYRLFGTTYQSHLKGQAVQEEECKLGLHSSAMLRCVGCSYWRFGTIYGSRLQWPSLKTGPIYSP